MGVDRDHEKAVVTRDRVEQATRRTEFRLGQWERAMADLGWTSAFVPSWREDLTTLSNALAESEKERERLQEAWDVWTEHNARRHGCDWGYTERPDRQALSPDEKRSE